MEESGLTLTWIWEHLQALLIALLTIAMPLFLLWYTRYLQKKDKTPHSVGKAVEKNRRLESICEEIMTKLGAQRVTVWLFHNGGYYYTGEPIQKLSIICEKNEEHAVPIIHIFQNQPISIFQRNLEKLTSNDFSYEYNNFQYKDSLAVLDTLYGIASSALFKLKNKESYFSGILSIGYSTHHTVTNGEIETVKELVKQIEIELINKK